MSDLAIHPNRTDHNASPEHRSAISAVTVMGREALRSAVEVVKFTANSFTLAGDQRNSEVYGDPSKANSRRGVVRMLHAAQTSEAAADRRQRLQERYEDWSYGIAGRALLAAHRSALADIAAGPKRRIPHPSEVMVPRAKRKAAWKR